MADEKVEGRCFDTIDVHGARYEKPKSAQGFIKLEVTRGKADPVPLETNWISFAMEDTSLSLEAYFGEDTGHLVQAVGFMAIIMPTVGDYEIRDPFGGEPWQVAALFGKGRPDANLQGDNYGKGMLTISDVFNESARKYIKGNFKFIYLDRSGVVVKVVSEEFSAEYDG